MPNYPKEKLWELYENLPKNLQQAVFSEKNADTIYDICGRNGIKEDDSISQIAEKTGHVLLGVLSPEDFQKTLEEELEIKKDTAKQIAWEINRFVFLAVKDDLEALYKVIINPGAVEEKTPAVSLPEKPAADAPKKKRKDIYRELAE